MEYVYSEDEGPIDSPHRKPTAVARPAGVSASSASPIRGPRAGVEYRRLAPEEIKAEQDKVVREVATVLNVPPECSNTLLTLFKQVQICFHDFVVH